MARCEEGKLLDRIAVLTGEATRLPRSGIGAYRREQIGWELIQLYRHLAAGTEREQRLQIVAQMWGAVETHVADAVVRERIKQAWLQIRT